MESYRPLNVRDALSYLDQVKVSYRDVIIALQMARLASPRDTVARAVAL
jgi:hypothetical protein